MTKPCMGVVRVVFAAPLFTGLMLAALVSQSSAITPDNPGPAAIQFTVNSGQNVKSISPWIYGSNFDSIPNARSTASAETA